MPTGVDRVELAYLRHLPTCPEPVLAIARTTLGYVLLKGDGLAAITARIMGDMPWGPTDRLANLARRKSVPVRQAESDLRRYAFDRCRPRRLGDMLVGHLPAGTAYLNTGHSNLSERMLWTLRHRAGARIAVLIHDTIPLDFPQYQRPGTPDRFRALLKRVRAGADLVICNSHHTKDNVFRHMSKWGDVPHLVVAYLGVDPPKMGPLPDGLDVQTPYFVALGTIEPRKGHELLLDIWREFAGELGSNTPHLLIIGRRGWNNKTVFDRLDTMPPDGPVKELPDLNDGAVATLLSGATALLFPSHAEGFGLPPVEAASLGVPVLCSDLPVIHEILGDIPVYASITERYRWKENIESLLKGHTKSGPPNEHSAFVPPIWDDHFDTVLRFT